MAKTEVILTHNVVGLGAESDQVKVAAGYARNYLYPQGLAIPQTAPISGGLKPCASAGWHGKRTS